MKKKYLVAAGITTILMLTGCQSGKDNAETEALKTQIAQLEQQVQALQEGTETSGQATPAEESVQPQENADAANDGQEQKPQGATGDASQAQADPASGSAAATTYTMDELTAMVDAYVEKAGAASANGTDTENMEAFFNLKQEEKEVDHALDVHEDELEYLYRQDSLTRDEYRKLERELELLEDRLDRAEDDLEYLFGIDD